MTDTHVLEIVTFRSVPDTDPAAFEATAAGLAPWLDTQPGFVARRLAREAGGGFVDCIEWRSLEAARAAADKIMSEPSAGAMMSLIDPESVEMRHYAIRVTQ